MSSHYFQCCRSFPLTLERLSVLHDARKCFSASSVGLKIFHVKLSLNFLFFIDFSFLHMRTFFIFNVLVNCEADVHFSRHFHRRSVVVELATVVRR